MSLPINMIQKKISDIIEKRSKQYNNVAIFIEKWKDIRVKLDQIEKEKNQLKRKYKDNHRLGTRFDHIDFSNFRNQIFQELEELENIKKRLLRSTLNIGVIGGMRQGKSRLLQTLTGLGNDEIPTGNEGVCTRVMSKIFHTDKSKKSHFLVKFHSAESLKEILDLYFDELDLPGYPNIPEDLDLGTYPPMLPLEKKDDVDTRYHYGFLRKNYYNNYQKYKELINSQPKAIYKEDIKKYITDEIESIAVKEIEIHCEFPYREIENIGVIDLPGLSDLSIRDTELLIKTLKQDIDFILFVRKPDPNGDDWKESDRNMYQIARDALVGFPINQCSFMILNKKGNEKESSSNLRVCNYLEKQLHLHEIDVSKIVIADCSNYDEVKDLILIPVLDNFTEKNNFVSEEYLNFQSQKIEKLWDEITIEPIIFLKQNIQKWNEWRRKYSNIIIDLREVDLSKANLSKANLSKANLSRANLSEANLSEANLSEVDFSGANLSRTNLSGLDLRGADLSGLDLSGADLSGANLSKTQALETDFTGAKFTGACLEDWNINSATKLDNIDCQYVYLKSDFQERRPSSGKFAPGEFSKLFQKALETVDLIFADGIDWKAFLLSFQELQAKYGEENLSVQAIEKKSGGAFVIRLEVPPEANKADIERQAKELYENKLNELEARYHTELKAKDEQIAIYRQQNATLENVINILGNRPIQNIITVTAQAQSESMSESYKSKYDLSNAQVGGIVDTAQTGSHQEFNQYNYTPEQRQNLAEAAAEIQQLLNQLAQTNPTTDVVTEAIHQEIKRNPTFKARLLAALKAGGLEALKAIFNHPAFSIPAETIKGWLEAE